MVKAQVKGLNMQSDSAAQWLSPSADGTWSSSSQTTNFKSSQTPASSLKRTRSVSKPMANLTPLPRLSGEIILEVFTHRSLRFPGAPTNEDSEFGDNDRLAILGEKALETAVTDALFRKRPMLKATDIEAQRDEALSPTNIEQWIAAYKLRDKLRCSPDAVQTLNSAKEARHLFHSYVGAVYAQNGMETVQTWIGSLVDPEYEPAAQQDVDMEQYNFKRVKTEPYSPPEPSFMPPPPPPPPANAPPPLPTNPMQSQSAFLPLFNQTATQRRLAVEYPAQFTGPAHAGKWTVKCLVNGIQKGAGTGASKQLAKEDAARQAYYAMGWSHGL